MIRMKQICKKNLRRYVFCVHMCLYFFFMSVTIISFHAIFFFSFFACLLTRWILDYVCDKETLYFEFFNSLVKCHLVSGISNGTSLANIHAFFSLIPRVWFKICVDAWRKILLELRKRRTSFICISDTYLS